MAGLEVARRTSRIAGLAALAVLTVILGVRAVQGALKLSETACQDPRETVPGWFILLIGLVMLGTGHLTARYRAARTAAVGPARARPSDVAVHVLLVLFFMAITVALIYETAALLALGGLQPITRYIQCARALDPTTTTLATGAVSFLVGHWLWFPDLAATRRR